jgi:hypothetical protein
MLILRFVPAVIGSTVSFGRPTERNPGGGWFVSREQAFLWSPD